MKILKVFGIVAGIHVLALIMIFSNPGCNSVAKPAPAPAPADTTMKTDPPPPAIGLPAPAPSADAPPISPAPDGAPMAAAAPVTPDNSAGGIPAITFSPTRPGTPAAEALEAQPVGGVTPATSYTVVRGDSLWTVAKKNNLRISVLAAANGLKPASTLHLGQKLIIPASSPAAGAAASTAEAPASAGPKAAAMAAPAASSAASGETLKHTVRNGETLGTIARLYGVKVGDLATKNNISDPKLIRPGQVLVIPAGGHAAGAKSAKSAVAGSPASSFGSTPAARAPASAPATAPAPAAAVPAANQDLDAGLTPGTAGDVPVIKIDDAPKQP